MAMAEIPECIGPYRVLSVVGEGGMGVVYKAEDPRLERVVALKVIREFDGDDTRRRRFWQEARAAAQVTHPNACRIYDITEERGRLDAPEIFFGTPKAPTPEMFPRRVVGGGGALFSAGGFFLKMVAGPPAFLGETFGERTPCRSGGFPACAKRVARHSGDGPDRS